MSDHEYLRAAVAVMRELGVTRWGDIELGPIPQEPSTQEPTQHESTDPEEDTRRAREAKRRIGLAACPGIRERVSERR